MNKLWILTCLMYVSINANYLVVNKSGYYILFWESSYTKIDGKKKYTSSNSLLSPGDQKEIQTNQDIPTFFAVYPFEHDVNKEAFEKEKILIRENVSAGLYKHVKPASDNFKVPDIYGEILSNAKAYLPIITITNDPKTNLPRINAPKTAEDLQKQIEQIKKEKIAATTR